MANVDLSPGHLEKQLEALDITNVEAAGLAGVSEATLYRWLNGTAPASVSAVRMFDMMVKINELGQLIGVSWSRPVPEEADDAQPAA